MSLQNCIEEKRWWEEVHERGKNGNFHVKRTGLLIIISDVYAQKQITN